MQSAERHWLSVARVALLLDLTPDALRRRLERKTTIGEDGAIEAHFDGIHARKVGRLWRVSLGPEWLEAATAVDSVRSRGARKAGKGEP